MSDVAAAACLAEGVVEEGRLVVDAGDDRDAALPPGLRCAAMTTGTALRHTRIGVPVLF